MPKKMIITIDGPAGSGKSTSAKLVATKLGFTYLDTGAMYRAVTFLALKNNVINDESGIIELAQTTKIKLSFKDGKTEVCLNGVDVTEDIRSFEVNSFVSEVSVIPEVRHALVKAQQEIGKNSSIVVEGRDTGTVVFPDADLKIFLIASIKERAHRRLKEFREKGNPVTLEEIEENISKRDKIDSGRATSPLIKAADAIEIDTSNITIDEQVSLILEHALLVAGKKGIGNFNIEALKESKTENGSQNR